MLLGDPAGGSRSIYDQQNITEILVLWKKLLHYVHVVEKYLIITLQKSFLTHRYYTMKLPEIPSEF